MLSRKLLFGSSLLLVLAGSAIASLCVWRQPDSDISGIFGMCQKEWNQG